MRVLLIYQEIPENIQFYGLNNPTQDEVDVLTQAQGGLINSVDTTQEQSEALDCIQAAITDPQHPDGFEEPALSWHHRWFSAEIDEKNLPTSGPFDKVFSCGFIL